MTRTEITSVCNHFNASGFARERECDKVCTRAQPGYREGMAQAEVSQSAPWTGTGQELYHPRSSSHTSDGTQGKEKAEISNMDYQDIPG